MELNRLLSRVVGVILLFQILPAMLISQTPEPSKRSGLHEEESFNQRNWELNWYGSEWSQEYREQLYRIGILQRIIHANTLRLPESMRRATLMAAAAPGNNWINLGPMAGGVDYEVTEMDLPPFKRTLDASDSGRPNQIVPHPLDPDALYLVSAEGGLWKTNDSGQTWSSLTEAQPSLALGALGIDPAKPSILYLGLGDIEEGTFGGTGIGILKSTDGGKTWSDPPIKLGKSRAVTSILVFPGDTKVILVGTDAGLFRSKDSGSTYQQVALPAGNPRTVRDILWIDGSRLVMTVGNNFEFGQGAGGANILTSSDVGVTWKQSSGLDPQARAVIRRFSLASAPSDHEIIYALASSTSSQLFDIFKSKDGGATWQSTGAKSITYTNPINDGRTKLASLLGGQGGYNQLAAVEPGDPDVAFFGGNLNLVRTSDGGATYTIISDWLGEHNLPYVHADFHCAAFDGRGNLWVGNDGGVAKSTNRGDTWSTQENRGLPTHLVYSVGSSLSSPNAVILGMQDNGTRVRTGATTSFPQRIYADGFGSAIHPLDQNLMLGSAYYTRILKSLDGGKTFKGTYEHDIDGAGNRNEAPFVTRIVPWTGDSLGNTVYTFVNSRLYKSIDFGGTWTTIPVTGLSGPIRNFGVAASDGRILGVVAEGGAIHLSTDGGSTWKIAGGGLPGSRGRLSYISFSPIDPKIIYVASVAPVATATHLWKSVDGGESWEAIDTAANFPHGVPVNVVVGDPGEEGTIYAGTHLGLYKSTDSGANWKRFGFGLPLVSVTDVYVAPDSSLIRVATYGRGVWELTE